MIQEKPLKNKTNPTRKSSMKNGILNIKDKEKYRKTWNKNKLPMSLFQLKRRVGKNSVFDKNKSEDKNINIH